MLYQNCQAYKEDEKGKVIGVRLGVTAVPNARYEIYIAYLRDEYQAQGTHVAVCSVLDKAGIITGIPVRLAWPGAGPTFPYSALPGNPNNEHPIVNAYNPAGYGPLALYVGDHNQPQSDILYGLGLPAGRHVSYVVTFREKGGATLPPVEPPVTDLEQRVQRIERALDALLAEWSHDAP